LRNFLQQAVFLKAQSNRPFTPIGDDLAAGAPSRITFYVRKQAGLSELGIGLPLNRGHIPRRMNRFFESDQLPLFF